MDNITVIVTTEVGFDPARYRVDLGCPECDEKPELLCDYCGQVWEIPRTLDFARRELNLADIIKSLAEHDAQH